MDRRKFIASSASLLATTACGRRDQTSSEQAGLATQSSSGAADRLIIDALGGIGNPNRRLGIPRGEGVPESPETIDERALADAKASGVTAINVTLGYVAGPGEPFEQSIKEIAWWDARVRANSEHLVKVRSTEDILDAQRSSRIGIIYGFQNATQMGEDTSRVATFERLGVRVVQLTYNIANQLGDGSMAPNNRGLSEFGREVVAELNNNNVLVDLSHSGAQTCLDAIAASKSPITISHSGCRALADLPRNKTDEELRRLADKGGVVGIYFMPFLRVGVQPLAADVIDHIEHALNVCGEDHVGIGTDGPLTAIDNMDQYYVALAAEVAERKRLGIGATGERPDIVPFIPDMRGPEQFTILADLLSSRGHSDRQIDKILGGNFLRLMGEVW